MADAFDYESTLELIEGENPIDFTWSGADYACSLGSRTESKTASEGGFALSADLQLVVRKSLFPDAVYPTSQQTLSVNSRTLRIESVEHDPTGVFFVLNCVDNTRGV